MSLGYIGKREFHFREFTTSAGMDLIQSSLQPLLFLKMVLHRV